MHTHHENVRDILHQKGLKATPLREKLIGVLKRGGGPMSAEEIGRSLKGISFDQASLFRTLKKLSEAGVISLIDLGEGFARYEYTCLAHDHHHHIICTVCKEIESLPFCVPKEFLSYIKKKGYRDVGHRLDFQGVCSKCH